MLHRLRAWVVRLFTSVRGAPGDDGLADELASHLQLHIDDNLRAGMSREEARRQALLKLGGVTQTREAHRDRRGLPWVDSLARDVKYAMRFLRRSPGFTAVAMLSLALGIGANTAIFSLVDALLLRSLPVKQPDRLVQLFVDGNRSSWTNPQWEEIRDRSDLFESVAAWSDTRLNLTRGGETQYANGLFVSGAFFGMLGVSPAMGRAVTPADDRPGGGDEGPVAVISDRFWKTRFGAAPDVVGRSLTLAGTQFTIIGVTPPAFDGVSAGSRFDVAIPLGMAPRVMGRDVLSGRSVWWLHILARLRPGETVAQATAGLRAAQPAIRTATRPALYAGARAAQYLQAPFVVRPARSGADGLGVRRQYEMPLLALMGIVALVLLIACVNLANLLLARAEARRHELSIRRALGASRLQLVRQLMTESMLLSGLGGAAGLLFAAWASRLLASHLVVSGRPLELAGPLDRQVVLFTAAVCVIVAGLFGLGPAMRASAGGAMDALAARGTRATGQRRSTNVLMMAQVALCLVLVVGTGLFVRTFVSLTTRQLGFAPGAVLAANLDMSGNAATLTTTTSTDLLDAVRAAPGVSHAAISVLLPLTGQQWDQSIENPPGLALSRDERDVYLNAVSPDWFTTLGTPLLAGRDFAREDTAGAPLVAIVNQTFVRKYLSGRNPLGTVIELDMTPSGDRTAALTIVGVARDALYDSRRGDLPPTLYRPFAQSGVENVALASIVVRAASGEPASIARNVAASIAAVDPRLNFTFHTLDDLAGVSVSAERVLALLSGFFGALALLLAAIGLYGVVSYSVSRRRTEIGIRMALGARPGGIVRMVLSRIGLTMVIGLVIGGALSVWLATFVKSLLYGLQPDDPATLAGAIAVLAAVGLLAAWLPARRAARIDPMEALREQ
ncbi:MAG TPA: ABC transporter permease [Vicinamibacterales bacterium]